MNKLAGIVAGALVSLVATNALAQQVSGQVGRTPPEDITLSVSFAADGTMTLSQTEFRLALGGYYRFGLVCPDNLENEEGIAFWADELWENVHLRIVSVADVGAGFQDADEINFHLQGLQIRQIDCEGLALQARFSFYPMRRGTFPFHVLNDTVQPNVELQGTFVVY